MATFGMEDGGAIIKERLAQITLQAEAPFEPRNARYTPTSRQVKRGVQPIESMLPKAETTVAQVQAALILYTTAAPVSITVPPVATDFNPKSYKEVLEERQARQTAPSGSVPPPTTAAAVAVNNALSDNSHGPPNNAVLVSFNMGSSAAPPSGRKKPSCRLCGMPMQGHRRNPRACPSKSVAGHNAPCSPPAPQQSSSSGPHHINETQVALLALDSPIPSPSSPACASTPHAKHHSDSDVQSIPAGPSLQRQATLPALEEPPRVAQSAIEGRLSRTLSSFTLNAQQEPQGQATGSKRKRSGSGLDLDTGKRAKHAESESAPAPVPAAAAPLPAAAAPVPISAPVFALFQPSVEDNASLFDEIVLDF